MEQQSSTGTVETLNVGGHIPGAVPFKLRTNEEIRLKIADTTPKKDKEISVAVEKIYNVVKASVKGEILTAGRIVIIVSKAMEVAGSFTSLEGREKKSIVKNLIRRVIIEEATFANDDERQAAIALLNMALSPLIDTLWKAFIHAVDYGSKAAKKCMEGCGCI